MRPLHLRVFERILVWCSAQPVNRPQPAVTRRKHKVQIMIQPVNPDIKRASVDTASAELEGTQAHPDEATESPEEGSQQGAVREIGGPGGPEPTRYGDWERNGRCIDF